MLKTILVVAAFSIGYVASYFIHTSAQDRDIEILQARVDAVMPLCPSAFRTLTKEDKQEVKSGTR